MKYKQELPKKLETKLDNYLERIKEIKWLQPSRDLSAKEVTRITRAALKSFGTKAKPKFVQLKTTLDWEKARETAQDMSWGATWGAARDLAWNSALNAELAEARDALLDLTWQVTQESMKELDWGAARFAARAVAWGAVDVLSSSTDEYKEKYPKGSFINFVPLWEIGVYPIGIVDGEFLIYVPPCSQSFPKELK